MNVDCPWCGEETHVAYDDCGEHACKACGKVFDVWLNEEGADSFGIHIGDYMATRSEDAK